MDEAQSKILKVFSYIRELTKLRTPPVSQTDAYDWSLRFSSLTSYPTIQTAEVPDQTDMEFDGIILRVKRPNETSCPPPPAVLNSWLETGWENIDTDVKHLPAKNKIGSDNQTITERFDESFERVQAFKAWAARRQEWQTAERPAREAARIFSNFFKLHGQIQRESEKYQLYLGDGHLVWESAIEPIEHPILLKKVELEFDSSIPEFIVRESEEPTELYSTLLRHHQLDGGAILACKKQIEDLDPHPLSNGKTTDFFKFFIQRFFPNGRHFESRSELNRESPAIYRDPILFLGNRTQGFTEALNKLIDSLPQNEISSEALFRIVGVDQTVAPSLSEGGEQGQTISQREEEIDFLLTKPANREQERVITRLEQTGSVLVQGPPGTGKSHTIANIIGHLLASGKTILVSSHTSKALKVVREKVVKPLQPLCVSVLENDLESKAQLEESINGIVSYLSKTDKHSLDREINQLGQRRIALKQQLEKLEADALEIRKGEYTDILVAGEGTPPSEVARRIPELETQHGWIPGPLEYGSPLPLSESEIAELYKTNETLPIEYEACLTEGLPDLSGALNPAELSELANAMNSLDKGLASRFAELWQHANQDGSAIERISHNLGKSLEIFSAHKWIHKVVEDSNLGKERLQPWLTLIALIESTNQKVAQRTELVLRYGPKINSGNLLEDSTVCREIIAHLETGGALGFFSTAFKPSWKKFIANCQVDQGQPSNIEHFKALLALLESSQLRHELVRRWERQVVILGGPKLDSDEPEVFAKTRLNALTLATAWTNSTWNCLATELESQGFNLRSAFEKLSLNGQEVGHIQQVQILVEATLIPAIESRKIWLRQKYLEEQHEHTLMAVKAHAKTTANSLAYFDNFVSAIENLDVDRYQTAYNRYLEIKSRANTFKRRNELLERLGVSAQGWANSIKNRIGIHGENSPAGNVETAWKVCQWRQELDYRISRDYSLVQNEIQRLKTELNGINAEYVEKLAWKYQHQRTGLKERQALTGWQQLQNKITKTGRGKRDAQLKRESRKTLKDCKNAVPVWIMPLSRVFDSFDLVQTKFDVVLLDEASQSDITALIAFAIAKQVIVVGDNEQVTPTAVGQELGKIQSLIEEFLQGIPNRMLYDGKTSVYDLAEQAFGETIRLVEHFRCVPDIIEFSNQLSYGGEIRPLRESSSSPYASHLISHRIDGAASSQNNTNHKEAAEIASIVCAMTEMPEYQNASLGVISMVGQEQSLVIDGILQRRLQTHEYSRHKLLCGNPSQFQGDERDVIILSMVDSCEAPPLSIRQTEDFKKRYNVAASRARNQLWVVHSLNPATDLKPGDLRLRLIRHAENPKELRQQILATQKKADPKSVVFEPAVIRDLMQAGFRVVPQLEVGAYTIDMIVEGNSKRIAIECDGDRYHPPEKLGNDLQRQMVLERLGWHFIRVRGSEYFRNRETTMKRVFSMLDSLGVERLGTASANKEQAQEDELRRKVLQRAMEIRKEWELAPEPEHEEKPKRGRWGRKPPKTDAAVEAFEGNAAVKLQTMEQPRPERNAIFERIVQKVTAPDPLENPDDWASLISQISVSELPAFLKEHGFEVIDKRPVGGALWVIDDPRFKKLSTALATRGMSFMLAPNGSGSTSDRSAWYTKRR